MRSDAATTGRWLRFVLLACTLLGLAAMHSLGHDPVLGPAGHGSHAVPPPSTVVADCHGGRCPEQAAPASEEPGPGHASGWAACLAIVAGFALAVGLALRHLRRARSRRPRGRWLTWSSGGRSPPAFTMIGLTTASTSVLRT